MTDPSLESIARAQDRTLLIVEQLSTKMSERIEHTDAWREKIDLTLVGDGNGRKGHNIRIDRLEQKIAAQMWFIRVLGGGLIALMLKAAAAMIS
jgi:hypothetical protein